MPKDRPSKRSKTVVAPQPAKPRKKLASPAATGDRGGAFERRVQAVRLLAMCLGAACSGVRQDFTVVKLQFQGRIHEHNTDDLVVSTHCCATGQTATVRMQMKRSLRATANPVFEEAVGLAWLDFESADFQRELDETLIVFDVASTGAMKGAIEVVNFARSSTSFESWDTKVHAPGFSNDAIRTAYSAIKAAVETYSESLVRPEELHQFVLHLRFLAQDLDSDRADGVETQKTLIRHSLPAHDADAVWAKLMEVCAELNGQAGEVDLPSLGRHLGQLADVFASTRKFRAGLINLTSGKTNVHVGESPDLQGLIELLAPLLGKKSIASVRMSTDDLPPSRPNSANSSVSRRLDRIGEWQKDNRYSDSLEDLELLEPDFPEFDEHQKARWYLLRGAAHWHLGDNEAAAADFELAPAFCNTDDRVCAAGIRAFMLRNDSEQAAALGRTLVARFPESFIVWMAATNALIQNGERFTASDIPEPFLEKAASWQLVASACENAEEDEGAVQAIQIAMSKADVTFFVRENYLRQVLRLIAGSPIHVFSRALPEDRAALLADAVSRFDNREQALWTVQVPNAQKEATLHLAYALVLLRRPQESLALIEEGRRRGIAESPEILRFELEALCDMKRLGDAVNRFSARLEELPDEALLVFAEACFNSDHYELIERVNAEVLTRPRSETIRVTQEKLKYLRWEWLLKCHDNAILLDEIAERGVTPRSDCIGDLVFAARAHMGKSGDETKRSAFIDRVAELVPDISDPHELAMAGQLMARVKRYRDAIGALERLLPNNTFTPLHVCLLNCYVHTEHRARARDLLGTMPATWIKSGEAQDLALTLYRAAGDWARMRLVAEAVVRSLPSDSSAWLQLVQIAASENADDFEQILHSVPERLDGDPKDILLIANAELRYGAVAKGLQRVYQVMRNNLDDVEIAATHLSMMLVARKASEEILNAPTQVGPGCSVEVVDVRGNTHHVTIDLECDQDLRPSAEFISPSSAHAQALLGLQVREFSQANRGVATSSQFQIKSITTVHKRLIDLSYRCANNTFNPSTTMTAIELPENEDGSYDFSEIQEMLESRNVQVAHTLDIYQHHAASLGLVAKMLGLDVIDIICRWPVDAPPLEVSTGLPERHGTFACAGQEQGPLVVDLSILVELARLEMLDVLEHFPAVFVSSMTFQTLVVKLEKIAAFPTSATLYSHEGRLGFTEQSADQLSRDHALIEAILLAISSYCQVVPAYGPDEPETNLPSLNQVLSEEDFSSLLICMERKAGLLALDGRLRKFAYLLEIPTASPQDLLKYLVEHQALRAAEYSRAIMKMVISRRNFIEISSADLVRMMDQGTAFATQGLNALRDYLSTPLVRFNSTFRVVRDFVCDMYAEVRCDFGAMCELIEYCLEPLLRHDDCPPDLDGRFLNMLKIRLRGTNIDWSFHHLLKKAIQRAKERSLRPVTPVAMVAQPIMGLCPPLYSSPDPIWEIPTG
ncbi:hypothetical protein K4A76_14595 [Pseudomonas sp. NEEL19]|uniref:tetratricopeptide repeat protein n=1 Tax=Pseudomonas sp. NEEL19 TaxID=2867409 RepID=UPI002368D9C1|nr:hypothetical protein [Pseudomonas sp. NEEL19]WDM57702.1 hypothetical protein K4A76_14595 [Pseudomonas sp. NEEL19]